MTSIIIVNYNDYEDTIDCVNSIFNTVFSGDYAVVIVDNCSTNNSYEQLKKQFGENEKVMLLSADDNKGYCAGNNIGISYALSHQTPDYIWILNPDTLVEKNTLAELNKFASNCNDLGILGNKLVYYPDTQYLQALGGGDFAVQKNGKLSPGTHFYRMQSSSLKLPNSIKLDLVIGASMYIPVSVIKKIGLMEETFFLYSDENEYCLRALKANCQNYAISSAVVYHKEGHRKADQKLSTYYYATRNWLYMTKMHYPNYLIRNMLLTVFSKEFLYLLVSRNFKAAKLIVKGLVDFLFNVKGKVTLK